VAVEVQTASLPHVGFEATAPPGAIAWPKIHKAHIWQILTIIFLLFFLFTLPKRRLPWTLLLLTPRRRWRRKITTAHCQSHRSNLTTSRKVFQAEIASGFQNFKVSKFQKHGDC
jgi:hypothetical protein